MRSCRVRRTPVRALASSGRLRRPPSPSQLPVPPPPSPCRAIPSLASLVTEDPPKDATTPTLVSPPSGGRKDATRGAGEREGLKRHVARAGHVNEEQSFAAEEALRDATLELDLVGDGRLDHHHATGIDDQPLPWAQVEIQEVT